MGNQASNFSFDIGSEVKEFAGKSVWSLYHGTKKVDRSPVSIFKLPLRTEYGLNALKRLRTIRHPHVLAFVDGAETEESVFIVTEPVTPLELWLETKRDAIQAAEDAKGEGVDPAQLRQALGESVLWGLRCVARALHFLHDSCALVHAALSPQAVFVTESGDWRLGGFDLVSELSAEGRLHSRQRGNRLRLAESFIAPEVLRASEARVPVHAVDAYSLGVLAQHCHERLRLHTP
eukprot:CAMPEP_0196775712 /NCGR_PEP_ID=MMETSP1104-20130614/4192_1 /TAXON_ID=33652 /ORGANISM="Cafeteria sp., Strain Caron Lab Isolate" /LENGTH=233 /DNA_ID=CAMNT_0042145883 /DNA_START=51 /DNA_END=749 /DNA_ORIENTATION=-